LLNGKTLNTYSVDYLDNDKNFVKNDFQPNSDNYYIDVMRKHFKTNHHTIVLDTPELAENLKSALIARDLPAMADIDSSLLLFCKHIKKDADVVLSGECSDEIFAGYPWFFKEKKNTFPWSNSIDLRQSSLNKDLSKYVNLSEYIDKRYKDSLNEIEFCEEFSENTIEKKKITYLTMNWFMQTLIDRADRMAVYSGLEVRVPFCDYRIAQYLWNIPWNIKALNNREKGLLRHISKDFLPREIVDRKKSPYPKTFNPNYLSKVKELALENFNNQNAKIYSIMDKDFIDNLLSTNGENISTPWYGQLMTGPQLIAYFLQIEMWLEIYNPEIVV